MIRHILEPYYGTMIVQNRILEKGNTLKRFAFNLLAFLAMVIMTGCSSLSLVNSWKDPAVATRQYRKLLVVGITENVQRRQIFEEVFASEVSKIGAVGIPSYTIIGAGEKPSRALLENAVRKSGADGVITTRLAGMKENRQGRTGFVVTDRGFTNPAFSGDDIYPNDLFDFYGGSVSYATFEHKAVDVTMSTKMTIETNLFDTGTGRLVWSGTATVTDPKGLITISTELADTVVKAMAKDGLM
jgi:hypothetical protein